MKYFFDTEFITGFKKPIRFLPTLGEWNKKEFFIQLVSIGIVSEDGREYYAVSTEFNPSLADEWVRENVLIWLPEKNISFYDSPRVKEEGRVWKSNMQIRNDIVSFLGGGQDDYSTELYVPSETEIYAYYADYDWVVFCSLFGRMIDLPSGMPKYCRDLKQILDEAEEKFPLSGGVKGQVGYPKQDNEHNALDDAKWNKKLYEFISNGI